MRFKIDYDNSLTSLDNSIRGYFGLEKYHNSLDYIDKLLDEKKPKNIVLILLDGMGSKIVNKTLDENDFFRKNMKYEISSVFPTTTTAATTSIRTGLNPAEHGWLAWNTYVEPLDKIISFFLNSEKGSDNICNKFLEVKNKYYKPKKIVDEIMENGKYYAKEVMPFGDDGYCNLDDMINSIKLNINKKDKNYIYAYDMEPDSSMHRFGTDSLYIYDLIKERNDKLEKLCSELDDTIIFIVADHGHNNVDNIYLNDYPSIINCLRTNTFNEPRCPMFKVKDGMFDTFRKEFNKNFDEYFTLYTKNEIIDNNFYGYGDFHPLFESSLGDFIAIPKKGYKSLISDGDSYMVSTHGGLNDEEVYVPLIIAIK